jgi:BASS family bile acid:Na+ symporter
MEVFQALFNTVLIVFIITTMLSAGLRTTFDQIAAVFKRWPLVLLVVVAAFVVRPLVGWGAAALFGLATPAFIAMVLIWACPGAPFGAKLVMNAKADLQTGAVLQVLMASIGSITFAPTANAIIQAANLGSDVSLPVGDLIKTVAFLQLLPFAVGVVMRHWTSAAALEWNPVVTKISNLAFMGVLAGALLGSWKTIVGLVGSSTLLAALLASVVMLAVGYVVANGDRATRKTAALLQPCSNAGPAFAAIAIAFNNDPEILGAATAILMLQIVTGLVTASYIGKKTGQRSADVGVVPGVQPSGA